MKMGANNSTFNHNHILLSAFTLIDKQLTNERYHCLDNANCGEYIAVSRFWNKTTGDIGFIDGPEMIPLSSLKIIDKYMTQERFDLENEMIFGVKKPKGVGRYWHKHNGEIGYYDTRPKKVLLSSLIYTDKTMTPERLNFENKTLNMPNSYTAVSRIWCEDSGIIRFIDIHPKNVSPSIIAFSQ